MSMVKFVLKTGSGKEYCLVCLKCRSEVASGRSCFSPL